MGLSIFSVRVRIREVVDYRDGLHVFIPSSQNINMSMYQCTIFQWHSQSACDSHLYGEGSHLKSPASQNIDMYVNHYISVAESELRR